MGIHEVFKYLEVPNVLDEHQTSPWHLRHNQIQESWGNRCDPFLQRLQSCILPVVISTSGEIGFQVGLSWRPCQWQAQSTLQFKFKQNHARTIFFGWNYTLTTETSDIGLAFGLVKHKVSQQYNIQTSCPAFTPEEIV